MVVTYDRLAAKRVAQGSHVIFSQTLVINNTSWVAFCGHCQKFCCFFRSLYGRGNYAIKGDALVFDSRTLKLCVRSAMT